MRNLFAIALFLVATQASFAQINEENVTQIEVDKTIKNPIILVYHSMGDVNVRGHKSDKLFVYAQEFLPSITELVNQNKQEVFTLLDKYTNETIKVNRTPNFTVLQKDSVFKIETNVFSYNSNVFVMVPERSSVGVNVKDMGNISIDHVDGNVEANTQRGNVFIKDADGVISASSVYGNIIGDFSNKARKNPLFISTFVGNIEIIVPKASTNSILATSEMGKFYSNFEESDQISMTASSTPIKNRKINFEINGGGTEFVINTFKGDIYLRHLSK